MVSDSCADRSVFRHIAATVLKCAIATTWRWRPPSRTVVSGHGNRIAPQGNPPSVSSRRAACVGSAATTEACAAVEFGLVALPFFALLFAIIQVGLVFFAGQALEGAVATASRMIRTGQAQQQNFDAAKFKDQICTQIETLFNCPEPQRRRPDHKDLRRRRPVAADRQGHRQSQDRSEICSRRRRRHRRGPHLLRVADVHQAARPRSRATSRTATISSRRRPRSATSRSPGSRQEPVHDRSAKRAGCRRFASSPTAPRRRRSSSRSCCRSCSSSSSARPSSARRSPSTARSATSASALGDLVAQSKSLSEADMQNILDASASIITPYDTGKLSIVVSQVKIDAKGKATVDWSQARNATPLAQEGLGHPARRRQRAEHLPHHDRDALRLSAGRSATC